jgi:HK97 family phage portal protein
MGWLTGPKASKDITAIADGRQNFMQLDPFGPVGRNEAGIISQDGSYANYATSGYGRNELVYACIRYRAESLPQSVLRVYPSGAGGPIDDHRLRKLFETPNPITDEFAFWELSSTYKDLAGTSFWLVVNGRDGLPGQLWPLRPDLVGVLPNPKDPADYMWIYRPDLNRPEIMVPIPDAGSPRSNGAPAYMIRVRYPNPNPLDLGSPYFGQPPLRPAARAASLDNAATDFVDSLLRNHAMPSVIIETESEITEVLHKRLKKMWQDAFSGPNRGLPAFLQKGMKVHEVGLSLTALEFPDLRDQSETRICGAFGVEPILVGTKIGLTHNAYKDYREARLSFWEEAMVSEQRRFVEPVRSRLLPKFTGIGRSRVRIDWDNSGVMALKEAEQSKWQRATTALTSGGITRNDFRNIVGLPAVANGDVFLTPSGVTPQQVGEDPAVAAGTVAASLGLMAAEYGIELSNDELDALMSKSGMEG